MITGELKSKVDKIWDTMWSGGISNPLSVIEQLTYLLFIKRLDELHTLKEAKAEDELRLRYLLAEIGFRLYTLTDDADDHNKGCSLVFTLPFSKLLRAWFAPGTSSRMDPIGWTGRGLAG